ncbi:MAG: carbohydrate kinase family protein [Gemmatimonadota bacterium]|nr:carbohydrate kinase family protein [Gemmatimonadota bacterium]
MPELGILGTLVLDTIHPPPGSGAPVVSDWGGIAYALAAFEASRPPGWTAVPLVRVGSDVRAAADELLARFDGIARRDGVVTVPEPNNRVELFYGSRTDRCERLAGGVSGWPWEELREAALSCDALYVNLVAGWELDVEVGARLRSEFPGRLYGDIHSLLLGTGEEGVRVRRRIDDWPAWRGLFDVVQMNEDELATLTGTVGPEAGAAEDAEARAILEAGAEVVFVTRGSAGADWWERAGRRVRRGVAPPAATAGRDVDPTGCGDVWGVVAAVSLVAGADPGEAAFRANRFAAAAAGHRGTDGLAATLARVAAGPAGGTG